MLIAEDLLLLLLDDERGTASSAWVAVGVPIGGALLAELALDGAVEVAERASMWHAATVRAVPSRRPSDPLLAAAYDVVAERPRSASSLVQRVGKGSEERVAERLAEAGVLERQEHRVLGLFRRDVWPARSVDHEQTVRQRLVEVLVGGAAPTPQEAALATLLNALQQLPKALGLHGSDGRAATRRAKELERSWAADAVDRAVQGAMVAIIAGTTAATTVAATTAATS